MSAVIKLQNVSFSYRMQLVLSKVSLQIDKGDFVGIIGPNGGGKTTLLKLIMGLLQPNSGTIHVFDQSPIKSRKNIGYVPQSMQFDRQFPISLLELVLEGRLSFLPWYGRFSHQDKEAAVHALKKMGIADLMHRPIGTLSGGQIQRALIARAIVCDPQILLLDEPTANVDPEVEAHIYALLQELNKTMTILMVTHDLHTAIDQVKRVFCVQKTVSSLTPEEVCKHFAIGLYHAPLMREES